MVFGSDHLHRIIDSDRRSREMQFLQLNLEILAQHAEEAALIWLERNSAVSEPHYDLPDLVKLDDRLDAHIDGLRIVGAAGVQIALDQLIWEEPGEAFLAAVLAFESNDKSQREQVLGLAGQAPELAAAVVSALGWLS